MCDTTIMLATATSAEAAQALVNLGVHLESCGGAASMVEGWSVGVGPPRAIGHERTRQDVTFISPCGKTCRSKAEVARFLGLDMEPAKQPRIASSSSSAEALLALGLLGVHLESCGGTASMVEGWSVGVGPPRAIKEHGQSRPREDVFFFSPCGKTCRSKAEVARFLGLNTEPAKQIRTASSSSSTEAAQALVNLSVHLESCGGTASMVEGWSVGVGPPRAIKEGRPRQDVTFFSQCGKQLRSKAEAARFLGLASGAPRVSRKVHSTSPQQASRKIVKRTKRADLSSSPTLWVNAMVVVDAEDEGDGIDATVVDAD